MTSTEYAAWMESHIRRHGCTDALIVAMATWERDLSVYPRATLDRASQRLLADAATAPERYNETHAQRHYRLLVAAVAALEGEAATRERQRVADDRGTCSRCGGSGAVSVPHPKAVLHRSEWGPPWYTACVVCDCPLGRWKHDNDCFCLKTRDGRTVRLMTLREYEGRVTEHWRELLIERDRALKERAAAARRVGDPLELRLDGILRQLSDGRGF